MSAARRLWRRAPAWRVCLVAALAATALAVMFPPGVPGWARRAAAEVGAPVSRVAAVPAGDGGAHFRPVAAAASGTGLSTAAFPPFGHERSGSVPFAGRTLPLPVGQWQTLVLARVTQPFIAQLGIFGRLENGAMTGMLFASAPDPVAHQPSPFNVTQTCNEPNSIAEFVAPEPFGLDPLVHECWRLASLRGFDLAERVRQDPVLDRALLRLKENDVRIPDDFVVLDYLRSDDSGFLSALLFLPDRRGGSGKSLEIWAKRYVSVLHEAYDGRVEARGVPVDPG